MELEARNLQNLVYHPKGDQIAFVRTGELGRCEIYLMNSDGTNLKQLTTGYQDYAPAFHPEGKQLLYTSRSKGKQGIYSIDLEGTKTILLTSGVASPHSPAYGPEGKYVLFMSLREIWIMNSDGTDKRKIAEGQGFAWGPADHLKK